MENYRTCTHTHDSGHRCKSAAVTGREYCGYHLRYRGRLMRMARYRARQQRFDLTLPPLDSLCSIQSALCQVAEALAADMIDARRAQGLLKALRFAKENLKDSLKDHANWHASPYQSEDTAAYDNFESDYGLPANLDVSTRPEVAFPPPPLDPSQGVILSGGGASSFDLSSRAQATASVAGVEGSAVSPTPAPNPYVRDYAAEAESAMQTHPEDIELEEVLKKYGYKAWDQRAKEHQKNERRRRQRKYFRSNYDRFVDEANARNIQRAAEKLMHEKLAADQDAATKKPPISTPEATLEEAKNTA